MFGRVQVTQLYGPGNVPVGIVVRSPGMRDGVEILAKKTVHPIEPAHLTVIPNGLDRLLGDGPCVRKQKFFDDNDARGSVVACALKGRSRQILFAIDTGEPAAAGIVRRLERDRKTDLRRRGKGLLMAAGLTQVRLRNTSFRQTLAGSVLVAAELG